jgi:hypothetical protein
MLPPKFSFIFIRFNQICQSTQSRLIESLSDSDSVFFKGKYILEQGVLEVLEAKYQVEVMKLLESIIEVLIGQLFDMVSELPKEIRQIVDFREPELQLDEHFL